MKKIGSIILVSVIILLTLSSCGSSVSCPEEEVDSYIDEMDSFIQEFDDGIQLLYSANMFTLSDDIKDFQEIRRNVENLEYPECAVYTHELSITAMEKVIDSFIAFLNSDGAIVNMRKNGELGFMCDIMNEEFEEFEDSPIETYNDYYLLEEYIPESPEETESFNFPDSWTTINPIYDMTLLQKPEL